MYNRYIPSGQDAQEDTTKQRGEHRGPEGVFNVGQHLLHQLGATFNLFGSDTKNAGIAGILKGFGLEHLDSGDILLLLILLLIFLEGDHTELVITLGLMLLLSGEEGQNE